MVHATYTRILIFSSTKIIQGVTGQQFHMGREKAAFFFTLLGLQSRFGEKHLELEWYVPKPRLQS